MNFEYDNKTLKTLHDERTETQELIKNLTDLGKSLFEQTALIQNRPFTDADVAIVQEFFTKSKEICHPDVWPLYWEHIEWVRIYAQTFGEELQSKNVSINTHELQVLALIHDIGRLVSPHRFFRTNLVGDSLLKRLGVRGEVLDKQVPEAKYFGRGGTITTANELMIEQQILMLSDNLARKKDGSLIRFDQIQDLLAQQSEHYTGTVFPSERFGKGRLTKAFWREFKLLNQAQQLLQNKYGISVGEVREKAIQKIDRSRVGEMTIPEV